MVEWDSEGVWIHSPWYCEKLRGRVRFSRVAGVWVQNSQGLIWYVLCIVMYWYFCILLLQMLYCYCILSCITACVWCSLKLCSLSSLISVPSVYCIYCCGYCCSLLHLLLQCTKPFTAQFVIQLSLFTAASRVAVRSYATATSFCYILLLHSMCWVVDWLNFCDPLLSILDWQFQGSQLNSGIIKKQARCCPFFLRK